MSTVDGLEDTEVLIPTRVGRRRGREWISDELFQLMDAFEYDLGRPSEGDKPRPAPPRSPRKRPPATARPRCCGWPEPVGRLQAASIGDSWRWAHTAAPGCS